MSSSASDEPDSISGLRKRSSLSSAPSRVKPAGCCDKVFGKKFATSGSPAYPVLQRFSWTNLDQDKIAYWIVIRHLDPDRAGQQWVAQNKAAVDRWLGK
jgi:glycine betaine/proline transport system substrate-binding protein